MKTKFTPGPWTSQWMGDETHAILCAPGLGRTDIVAEIIDPVGYTPRSIRKANSILMAASPDLYAALEALVRHMEVNELVSHPNTADTKYDQPAYDAAVRALAKARGDRQ